MASSPSLVRPEEGYVARAQDQEAPEDSMGTGKEGGCIVPV